MVKVVWVRARRTNWCTMVLCDKIRNFLSRAEPLTNNALLLVRRSLYRVFLFSPYHGIVTEFGHHVTVPYCDVI